MTKEERQIRDENIVKDIVDGKMKIPAVCEKYKKSKRTIQRALRNHNITNIDAYEDPSDEKRRDDDVFDDSRDENFDIEDLREENELLQDQIAALEATVKELKADTAHIGHASIDVLDDKCSKEFVIRIKKCGDDPQREEVCTYDEALSLLMEYTNLDEDNLRKRLDLYNQQKEQAIGNRVTLVPNHGQKFKALDNDVKDWKDAYQKLNERIKNLENKL